MMQKANISLEKRAKILEQLPLGKDLAWEDVENLAKYMDPFQVEGDQVIFEEGDQKAFMLIVLKGSIKVIKDDGTGKMQTLHLVRPGKVLGEMALVDGAPRSASAVTAEPTLYLRLTLDSFLRLQEQFPKLGNRLYAYISRLLSQKLRQTSGTLVEHMHRSGHLEPVNSLADINGVAPAADDGSLASALSRDAALPLSPPSSAITPPRNAVGGVLLDPARNPDAAQLAKAINQLHQRLVQVERHLSRDEHPPAPSVEHPPAPRKGSRGGGHAEGFLKTLFTNK